MAEVFSSYVSKVQASARLNSGDVLFVSSSNLSVDEFSTGPTDVFKIDKRTIPTSITQTTQSLNDLRPEISTTYPYKIVPPLDFDSASIILSPTIETPVTASQNYYVPVYFERYNRSILQIIDKEFKQLTPPPAVSTRQVQNTPGE